ncbi:MAG: UDP-N-acetylmuramoyl-tripeptide--D-alanyl-D-alanine ligase [Calditrichota bacterium]
MEQINLIKFIGQSETVVKTMNIPADFMVNHFSIDSRTIGKGDAFIAIKGERVDGHQYINKALEKGVSLLVIDQDYPIKKVSKETPVIFVTDTTRFLMEFSGWYRRLFDIPVIGLTGSSGKTTTKEFLAAILQQRFNIVKTEGNKNNFIGVPLNLLDINKETEIAVIEMGTNHPGEIAELTEIVNPTIATITNIGTGHIGFFGSQQEIYKEKKALFDKIDNGAVIFLNMEDRYLRTYQHTGITIKKVAFSNNADYVAELTGIDRLGCVRFKINHGPEIQLGIPGHHQLMNATLAAAISLHLNISPELVKKGLEEKIESSQRMEVFEADGIVFINDAYNSNPQSLEAAIDYLTEFRISSGGRKFLIVGDMLELGDQSRDFHSQIGKYLLTHPVDFVYGYGPYCQILIENAGQNGSPVEETAWFLTHQEIAEKLRQQLKQGDVVLIKGSRGMTMEKVLTYLGIGR